MVHGSANIPKKGAVIFVAAPHANQFVDPMILVRTCNGRSIRFLMAAVSLRRKFIGFWGRIMQSVPVERPTDLAKKGSGKIVMDPSGAKVSGLGTRFTVDCTGDKRTLYVNAGLETYSVPIKTVISDTELELARPLDVHVQDPDGISYSIGPSVDQSQVYASVYQILDEGGSLGVFPEGGSHDRSAMLPLKAGVALMALGAMHKNPLLEVTVIPVGLNYFNPDRFRSRAIVEYGNPIIIERQMVTMFGCGGGNKREACAQLLEKIFHGLQNVTLNLPDYESYELVNMAKDLYKSANQQYSSQQELELARKFAKGLLVKSAEPKLQELKRKMIEYRRLLRAAGLKDFQVRSTAIGKTKLVILSMHHVFILLISALLLIPIFLMMGPLLWLIDLICQRKAHKALKSSSVKIRARDVIATWKIILGAVLFPILDIFWAVISSFVIFGEARCFYCLGFIFLIFPIISYSGVKAFEMAKSSLCTIRPLILATMRPNSAFFLRTFRHELRKLITESVEEFGPQVFENFSHTRIVKRHRLSSAHNIHDKPMKSNFSGQAAESIDGIAADYKFMQMATFDEEDDLDFPGF